MKEPKRVVPENLAKLMSPEDRKKLGIQLMSEIVTEKEISLERDLHNTFIAFLRRNNLGFYHADPSRKATIAIGMPDFGVFRNSRIIWIEFKVGGNKLSDAQKNRIATMLTDGNEVHVCYGYPAATEAVAKFFGISKE